MGRTLVGPQRDSPPAPCALATGGITLQTAQTEQTTVTPFLKFAWVNDRFGVSWQVNLE